MKSKGLLLAVLLLAGLGGVTWWSNKQEAKKSKDTTDASSPKILSIPTDQVIEMKFQKPGAEPLVLSKAAGKWEILGQKKLPADLGPTGALISALSDLKSDKLVEEKAADLKPYGLIDPTMIVTVGRKDGKTDTLLVGDETPTGSGSYVKLASDARVFTIATYTKSGFDKTATELRDKRLLTFDSDKLSRLELTAKGPPIEFGKTAQKDWQILKPRPMRADGSQVEDLIRKLKDAQMDANFLTETEKAAAGYAGGTKVAVASVTGPAGTQTIEIHRDKDKNYYGKSSAVEGIYRVTADLGEATDKDVEAFRAKKLFDFGFTDPTKVEIRNGAAQPVAYTKSGDKWNSGAKQMENATVQTLIDKLRELAAIKLLDKDAGNPVFEATVTSGDGTRTERVTIKKQENQYFARRENEATVYELDSHAVEDLQKTASNVKEAAPAPAAKKK